jgi:hypothetical protein
MSLIELFQFALVIGLFICFMNWPLHPTIWRLQKRRMEALMELRAGEENQGAPPPNPPMPRPDATSESN